MISSLDVYRAFGAVNEDRETDPVPLDEESPVRVYRVDLEEHEGIFASQVWASGLTTITSCTFDRAGNFWATEMFKFNAPAFCLAPGATPCGDVVRIPFGDPAHPQHIGGGASPWFPFPGGIAQGGDGAMYVTVNSAFPGAPGAVVRLAAA